MAVHKWWHRFVRRRTKPIPEDLAVLWKRRLSIAYGILAWNAFGVLVYSISQGKMDWAHYHGLKTDEERSARPEVDTTHQLSDNLYKVFAPIIDVWSTLVFTSHHRKLEPFLAASWADTLGIRNAKVYRISGLTKVHEYEIKEGEIIEERKKSPSEEEELTE